MPSVSLRWVVMFVLAAVVNVGAHFVLLPEFDALPSNFERGERLLVTPDGYYYQRQAEDWSAGRYTVSDPLRPGLRPHPAPPLSVLTASIAKVLDVPVQRVAFFLPPLLASLFCLVPLAVGGLAGSLRAGFIGALLLTTSEAWFSRSTLGVFDTDCLIPFLLFGLLLCLYMLDMGRWLWGIGVLVLPLCLHLWWPQGGIPLAAAAVGLFATTAFLPGGRCRWLKVFLFGVGAVVLFLALSHKGTELGGSIGQLFYALEGHVRFLLGTQQTEFLQTGWSVEELIPLQPLEALTFMGGHWALACAGLAGCCVLFARAPRVALYTVLPSLAFFCASLVGGNRFIMFTVLAQAMGLGWLCAVVVPRLARSTPRLAPVVSGIACSTLLVLGMWAVYDGNGLKSAYGSSEVSLARAINEIAAPDAAVWNWWGPGYMVQEFAQRETFFDGGLQGPNEAYIAALPLAAWEPLLARNWIKFFSVHPDGLDRLAVSLGKEKAVRFLRAVFSQPSRLEELVQEYRVPYAQSRRFWLFPQREVYLVLMSDMLLRNSWLTIGQWRPGQTEPRELPIYAVDLPHMLLDRPQGIMSLATGRDIAYSKLLFITPDQLSHDNPRDLGPVVLLVKGLGTAYVVQQAAFQALAFQLLYIHPNDIPGFTPVVYNPFVGGVWLVS